MRGPHTVERGKKHWIVEGPVQHVLGVLRNDQCECPLAYRECDVVLVQEELPDRHPSKCLAHGMLGVSKLGERAVVGCDLVRLGEDDLHRVRVDLPWREWRLRRRVRAGQDGRRRGRRRLGRRRRRRRRRRGRAFGWRGRPAGRGWAWWEGRGSRWRWRAGRRWPINAFGVVGDVPDRHAYGNQNDQHASQAAERRKARTEPSQRRHAIPKPGRFALSLGNSNSLGLVVGKSRVCG